MNKTTVALSKRQYKEIIKTMREGGTDFKPNVRIATALVIEANLGLRIEDILSLKLGDIIADGNRYRLNIVEKKTGKKRVLQFPNRFINTYRDMRTKMEKHKMISCLMLAKGGFKSYNEHVKMMIEKSEEQSKAV